MSDKGTIHWQRFDKDDRDTYPPYLQELILIVLKDGRPRFIPKASFGITETWQEIKSTKMRGGVQEVTKSVRFNTEDYDDINWAVLNVPEHWKPKSKPAED